jgi:hypothetical protein
MSRWKCTIRHRTDIASRLSTALGLAFLARTCLAEPVERARSALSTRQPAQLRARHMRGGGVCCLRLRRNLRLQRFRRSTWPIRVGRPTRMSGCSCRRLVYLLAWSGVRVIGKGRIRRRARSLLTRTLGQRGQEASRRGLRLDHIRQGTQVCPGSIGRRAYIRRIHRLPARILHRRMVERMADQDQCARVWATFTLCHRRSSNSNHSRTRRLLHTTLEVQRRDTPQH